MLKRVCPLVADLKCRAEADEAIKFSLPPGWFIADIFRHKPALGAYRAIKTWQRNILVRKETRDKCLKTSSAFYSGYSYPRIIKWHISAPSQWETVVIMSSLIQSQCTMDRDQPVTVMPVFLWANQCIHQRHAERHLPSVFQTHCTVVAPIHLHTCLGMSTHTPSHTHAVVAAYLTRNENPILILKAKYSSVWSKLMELLGFLWWCTRFVRCVHNQCEISVQ